MVRPQTSVMTSRWCEVPVDFEMQVRHVGTAGSYASPDDAPVVVHARPNEPLNVDLELVNHGRDDPAIVLKLVGLGQPIVATTRIEPPASSDVDDVHRVAAEFVLPSRLRPGVNPVAIEWVDGTSSTASRLAVVDLLVQVDDASLATIKLSPQRISGLLGKSTKVVLENTGDLAVTVRLRMTSPDRKLHADFTPEIVELAPRQQFFAVAMLRRRARWLGARKLHVFDVTAYGSSGSKTAAGSFRQLSVFPPLLFKIIAVVVLLIAALIGVKTAARSVVNDNKVAGWVELPDPPEGFAGRVGDTATWVQFQKPNRPSGVDSATARAGDWITGHDRSDVGVVVFGGMDAAGTMRPDGAYYSTTDNAWTAIPPLGDDEGRVGHQAVWTGDRMVVWGGFTPAAVSSETRYGAQFDPVTSRWAALPDSHLEPRVGFSMIWTGKELIIFGGMTRDGRVLGDGGILRAGRVQSDGTPTADNLGDLSHGIWDLFQSDSDTTQLSNLGGFADAARAFHAAAWDGRYMLISGGVGPDGVLRSDSVVYDVAVNRWSLIKNPLAVPEACHQAVATPGGFVLLGGLGTRDLGSGPVPVDQQLSVSNTSMSTLCSSSHRVDRKDPVAWLLNVKPDTKDPFVPTFEWKPLADAPEHLATDFVAAWTGNAIGIAVPVPSLDSVSAMLYTPGDGTELQPLPSSTQLGFRAESTAAWHDDQLFVWGGRDDEPCPDDSAVLGCPEARGARFEGVP